MSYETFNYTSEETNLEGASSSNHASTFHAVVEGSIEFGISNDGWSELANRIAEGSISKLTLKNISGGPSNLPQILQNAKSLQEVEFDASTFHYSQELGIISSLQQQEQLSSLSIQNYEEISGAFLKGIAVVINNSAKLNALKLHHLDINENENFDLICKAIADSKTLKTLEIKSLNLSEFNQKLLIEALSTNPEVILVCNDADLKAKLTYKSVGASDLTNLSNAQVTFASMRSPSFFGKGYEFRSTIDMPNEPAIGKKKSFCVIM